MGKWRRVNVGMLCGLWLLAAGALRADVPWLMRGLEPPLIVKATNRTSVSWSVSVNEAALSEDRLAIEWLDGARVELQRTGGDVRAAGRSWFGRIQPDGSGFEGDVVFAVVGEAVVGTFYTARGVFALRTDPETGVKRMETVDTAAWGACEVEASGSGLTPESTMVDGGLDPTQSHADPPHADLLLADPPDRLDVLVLFTPDARDGAGGSAAIEATAAAAIASANLALANSGVTPRFSLVHVAEADYVDSGILVNDLLWLRNHPTVHVLRDAYRADVVAMLVEDGGGACGRANVQRTPGPDFADDAASVTARACAVDNLSFAHELAHNLGCEHDPAFGAPPGDASFPWSFGHAVPGAFRTVMAYSGTCGDAGCARQPLFSNPNLALDGVSVGVAGARDNARTIEATASIVANFRTRWVPLFHDGFESGAAFEWDRLVTGDGRLRGRIGSSSARAHWCWPGNCRSLRE